MADEVMSLKKVVESASLISVYLKDTNCNISVPPEFVEPANTNIKINHSFNSIHEPNSDALFCFIATEVVGTLSPAAKEKHPDIKLDEDRLFTCECVFVARYSISKDITTEECDAFTRSTAFFNTYPYIREYLSAEITRMGLPGFFLPLFKTQKSIEPKLDNEAKP